MYSGTTFRIKSGRMMGVHQRIDRLARRNIVEVLPGDVLFPDIATILHFEGKNGPDGIKSKSPGTDEPWHFVDPKNPDDTMIFTMAHDHIVNLAQALHKKNMSRAGFEAAWLAHTIVDGLTPAHHFPLGDKIEELWGKPHTERGSVGDKNIIRGKNRRDSIRKNWEYWGAKGVFTTHILFELGVASSIGTHRFSPVVMSDHDKKRVKNGEFIAVFHEAVHEVNQHGMYERFYKHGWTSALARESREFLVPMLVRIVMLGWYAAVHEATH